MTNIEPKDQKQQGKHIRYMLPVELELWGFPGNVLLFNKKGLLMPYTVTEKEQKDIEECVKKEHTSFDEELKKRFETFFNNTEEPKKTLSSFRSHYPEYENYAIHFKLAGTVRLAKEGEKGLNPTSDKPEHQGNLNTYWHRPEGSSPSACKCGLPHFQQLLDQFKGNLVFKRLVTTNTVTPDEHLYRIETNDGHYYVFEIDFIENFAYVADFITSKIGGFKYFVEVKEPPKKFEDTRPFKVSCVYPTPSDFDEFKKYANDKYGSFEGYFNFLIKI